MPAARHQREFPLIMEENVLHPRKAAVTVWTKDIFVYSQKEIVGLEAKEIVH
jgi:hypothetical protein